MTVLFTQALDPEVPKIRWMEPYVTAGLNQKTLGQYPMGVFAGFTVVADSTPGAIGVILQADPTLGFSGANILDVSTDKYCVTLIQEGDLTVDLSSVTSTTVYVALDAQYQIGVTSTAQIKVVDAAELGLSSSLVLLAKVNVPAFTPLVQSQVNTAYRNSAGDALPQEARPQINLINNGTFETDTASASPMGWSNYANIGGPSLNPTVDNTVFRSGLQSLKLNAVSDVDSGLACTPISVQPGQSIRASAWIRSATGDGIVDGSGVVIYLSFLANNYSEVIATQLEAAFFGNSTTWVQRQGVAVAPASAAYAVVVATFLNCKGTLYIDDIELTTRGAESIAQSPVFGGPTSIADTYHLHTASGSSYAGGPSWADGTTNPPTTVEAQLDKIISDLAGAAGAPKVGNAPSKILHNVFVNTVSNTPSIDATGNGTATGIIGRGGASNGSGLEGVGVGTGAGGILLGVGAAVPALTGQGGVAVGATSGSPDGFYAAGGGPNGNGLHGVGTGTGIGVFGEAQTGQNAVGVRGLGHGSGSGGFFQSGTDSTAGAAALTATAQGSSSKGLTASSTGTQPAVEGLASSGNGIGGNFAGSGSGNGLNSAGGSTGSGVTALGGATSGYGVFAMALGGNSIGVYGQSQGSAAGVTGQGSSAAIGTDSIRPNGFGGGGGAGATTGTTASHGGDAMDVQGGSSEFLPATSSSSTPYPRGSAGHGVIGRAGSGRVAGNGIYGFGGLGYNNGIDTYTGPGYGVFGLGPHSDGRDVVIANADAGHGVAGIGGDSDNGMIAGHGVRGQGGTDTALNGFDGSCFYATPANSRAKALLISGNVATIAYETARVMKASVMGSAFAAYSEGTTATYTFTSAAGLECSAQTIGDVFQIGAQVRLPLNAVITSIQYCVAHNGSGKFAGSGVAAAVSKQWPNGTAIGGTTFGTASGQTPTMTGGSGGTQVFTLTLGSLTERTVTATDQAFVIEIGAVDGGSGTRAVFEVLWFQITYNMFDWLYLP